MQAGQFIDAYRECQSLIGSLQKNRADLIEEADKIEKEND